MSVKIKTQKSKSMFCVVIKIRFFGRVKCRRFEIRMKFFYRYLKLMIYSQSLIQKKIIKINGGAPYLVSVKREG